MEIVVVTHGEMSQGLLHSCNMYYGKLHNVHAISLLQDMNINEFKKEFNEFVDKLGNRILILCDVNGGTPYNTACEYKKNTLEKEIAVMTGVNLPMIIDSIERTNSTVDLGELCNEIMVNTMTGIKIVQ
ncbi:PTS sugar transporter subunit IIA [Cetobacterium sp. SF1]|uniref:PTS sugar transporter subunit IIA n=1 Tax=unclassified Cetobacterium TaxID=2630983 RepID=UPI003CF7AB5C